MKKDSASDDAMLNESDAKIMAHINHWSKCKRVIGRLADYRNNVIKRPRGRLNCVSEKKWPGAFMIWPGRIVPIDTRHENTWKCSEVKRYLSHPPEDKKERTKRSGKICTIDMYD